MDTVNEYAFCPKIESEEFDISAAFKLLEVMPEEEVVVELPELEEELALLPDDEPPEEEVDLFPPEEEPDELFIPGGEHVTEVHPVTEQQRLYWQSGVRP